MFRSPRPAPVDLSEADSFKRYLDYYTQRAGLTENKLALGARIYQQRLNKISNGIVKNVDVETLVRLCLVLGLTEQEAVDLMARRERAFSPANPLHRAYRELLGIYAQREIGCQTGAVALANILNEADEYLKSRGFEPFYDKSI